LVTKRGAFTGAAQRRLGRFESAEGGTIFLDEIGDLSARRRRFLFCGFSRSASSSVSAETSPSKLMSGLWLPRIGTWNLPSPKAFREDLFHWLNVFPIEVPPLRRRKADIPVLAEYFVDRYASKTGKKITGINKSGLELSSRTHGQAIFESCGT